MKIIMNGKIKSIKDKKNLKSLIAEFCRDSNHVIAELNNVIIKRDHWDKAELKSGDTLELINFVGGG